MRACLLSVLVVLGIATTPSPATAEDKASPKAGFPLYFVESPAAKFVPRAFAQPHGRLAIEHLASILQDSAEPGCVRTKGLTKEQFAKQSEDILVRRGTQRIERFIATIDLAAYNKNFAATAGADTIAEYQKLLKTEIVRAYLELEQVLNDSEVVNATIEDVGRFAAIMRIKLARLPGATTDNDPLAAADPTSAAGAKIEELVKGDKAGTLNRFFGIAEVALTALESAVDHAALLKIGPVDLLKGVEADFSTVCVPGTQ